MLFKREIIYDVTPSASAVGSLGLAL